MYRSQKCSKITRNPQISRSSIDRIRCTRYVIPSSYFAASRSPFSFPSASRTFGPFKFQHSAVQSELNPIPLAPSRRVFQVTFEISISVPARLKFYFLRQRMRSLSCLLTSVLAQLAGNNTRQLCGTRIEYNTRKRRHDAAFMWKRKRRR